MKRTDWSNYLSEASARRLALAASKNADYAKEDDILLNFKQVSAICQILDIDSRRSPEDCVLFFEVHKLQRYCNLRGREPGNEAVQDTVDDGCVYWDLAMAARRDAE